MTYQNKVLARSIWATVRGLKRQMTTPRVVLGRIKFQHVVDGL